MPEKYSICIVTIGNISIFLNFHESFAFFKLSDYRTYIQSFPRFFFQVLDFFSKIFIGENIFARTVAASDVCVMSPRSKLSSAATAYVRARTT